CSNQFIGKVCGSHSPHLCSCGRGRKLISPGKHWTAASYCKPVDCSEQKEICCLDSQKRPRQPEFGRIFLARPHWFGAESRHGYHIRWTIDPASAFRTHCNRRTGRRRIRAPSSEPGLHRPRPDVRSSARIWAGLFPGRLKRLGGIIRVCAQTRDLGNRPAANGFYRKKSLPRLLISGIPRARAETTTLLSTSNCIGFGDVQRRRAGAGGGAVHFWGGQAERRGHNDTWSRGHKRRGPGDHSKDSAGDF